jgi:hypothetical protein
MDVDLGREVHFKPSSRNHQKIGGRSQAGKTLGVLAANWYPCNNAAAP